MVVSTFTVAGDVNSFNAAARAGFRAGYAAKVGYGATADSVILTVEPASIKVTATVSVPDAISAFNAQQALQALSAAQLSNDFGSTITSVDSIATSTRAYEAPSPPPPINPVPASPLPPRSPSPASPPPMPPQAPPEVFPVLAVALGAGIPGGILLISCILFILWRIRKAKKPVLVKTVSSKDIELGVDTTKAAPATDEPAPKLMSQETALEKLDEGSAWKATVMDEGPSEERAPPAKLVSFSSSVGEGLGGDVSSGDAAPPSLAAAGSSSRMLRSRTVRKIHIKVQYEMGEHIGAELQVNQRGKLEVSSVQPGSIAANAGLQVGAVLVEANGVSVRGMSSGAVATHLRAQTGTRQLVFSKSTSGSITSK